VEPGAYAFELESKRAEKFRLTHAGVYEDMTESAFLDFRQELVKRLGMAVKVAGGLYQDLGPSAPSK
jgi:hypothetical protein